MPGASLPVAPLAYDPTTVAASGLPSNMCILNGFPTKLNSALKPRRPRRIRSECGSPTTPRCTSPTRATASGRRRRPYHCTPVSRNGSSYERGRGPCSTRSRRGLVSAALLVPRRRPLPEGEVNLATGVDWAPLTAGLRNITGRVNGDGTVTIWAITATVSGNGDQGADPNLLVAITDDLTNTERTSPEGDVLPRPSGGLRRGAARRLVHAGHVRPVTR